MGRKPVRHQTHVDLSPKHTKMLGRIRMSLGRWGNPASMSTALRMAIEVLDEQLHPKRSKATEATEPQPEPGVTSQL